MLSITAITKEVFRKHKLYQDVKAMLDIGLCDEAIIDATGISYNELNEIVDRIEMDSNYYGNPEYGFADVRDYPEFDNAEFESAFDSDELPF